LFWFFGYARVIFLLAPASYLLFGLRIYNANLREIIAYALPHLIASMLVADYLFGKVRWAFVSELYETMQSFFSFRAIFRVLLNPWAPKFLVTPKGEHVNEDFISDLATPFYVVYAITVIALMVGVYRYFNYAGERDTIYVTMAWELLNLVMLNASLGALCERRQRRTNPRMPADVSAHLRWCTDQPIACKVNDLSDSGALVIVPAGNDVPAVELEGLELVAYDSVLEREVRVPSDLCNRRVLDNGDLAIGLQFKFSSLSEKAAVVALTHGDSRRWSRFIQRRNRRLGIWKSAMTIFVLSTKYAGHHFAALFMQFSGIAAARFKMPRRSSRALPSDAQSTKDFLEQKAPEVNAVTPGVPNPALQSAKLGLSHPSP
jgi:cellulose synthase (UDP-forming)